MLQHHVMHNLVIAALQEGGIDGAERLEPLHRQAGGKGHRMLFGDADVETAGGKLRHQLVQAGSRRHRRGDGHDFLVGAGLGQQSAGKHRSEGRGIGLRLGQHAGHHVELAHPVIFVGGRFRRRIAASLLGHHMDQDGSGVLSVADILQDRQQMVEIVAVHRTDIIKAQLLEQGAAGHHAAGKFLGPFGGPLQRPGEQMGQVLHHMTDRMIGFGRQQPRQIVIHGAHRRRDGHVVVVEDHHQARLHRTGVVQRLIGHAGAHRAVADHRHHMVGAALQVAAHRHAQTGGNAGGRMAGAERVIGAFGALGEA